MKTLQLENPKFKYKVIESNNTEEIINEIDADGEEVRYIEGIRYVKKLKELSLDKDEENRDMEIKNDGVYLITGGAGGLGLIFAKYLANKANVKLVLTGRSDLTPEKQTAIDEIISLGSEVLYIRADVSDEENVHELIRTIREKYVSLNGVIHSAGIIHDAFIIKKTKDQITEVIKPKIYGIKYLYDSLEESQTDFFVCFSSIAGVFGNIGQCDYAYANSYMDNFALQNKGITSINWPLWKDGGMKVDKEIEKMFKNTTGIFPLCKENGIKTFNIAIIKSQSQLIVLEGEISKILRSIETVKRNVDEKKIIKPENHDNWLEKLQIDLLKEVSKILRINEADIDIESDLSSFGFDSITFTQFSNKINDIYKISINPSIFFEYQTLQSFSKYIIESYNDTLHEFYGTTINITVNQSGSRNETSSQSIKRRDRFINGNRQHLIFTKYEIVNEPIAIIGMAGIMPQSPNLETFWQNLINGVDMITQIPKDRWNWEDYKDQTNLNMADLCQM